MLTIHEVIDQIKIHLPFGLAGKLKVLALGVVLLEALQDDIEISVTVPLLLSLPPPKAIV